MFCFVNTDIFTLIKIAQVSRSWRDRIVNSFQWSKYARLSKDVHEQIMYMNNIYHDEKQKIICNCNVRNYGYRSTLENVD